MTEDLLVYDPPGPALVRCCRGKSKGVHFSSTAIPRVFLGQAATSPQCHLTSLLFLSEHHEPVGEMVQWVGSLAALPEDPDWIPAPTWLISVCNSSPRGASINLHRQQAHTWCTYMHVGKNQTKPRNKYAHKINKMLRVGVEFPTVVPQH